MATLQVDRIDLHPRRDLWWSWTMACAIGELMGFGIAGALLHLLSAVGMPEDVPPFGAVFSGAPEGASLGLAQWLVLRHYLPNLSCKTWVVATMLAVTWARGIVVIGNQVIDPSGFDLAARIATGITFALLFLLPIGSAQWLVLRHHVPNSGWWVLANAIAWPAGDAMPFAITYSVPQLTSVAAFMLVETMSGLFLGRVVGALTGLVLVWMLKNTLR